MSKEKSSNEQSKKPKRNIEQDRIAFIDQVLNTSIVKIDVDYDEESVYELNIELNKAKLLLLGETHGVKENADTIYTIFKKFGFRKLALEWCEEWYAQAEMFLCNKELKFEAIQDSPDGRITAGHFALLKKLKEEGLLDTLVCFDNQTQSDKWDDRDLCMANNILKNMSGSKMLVLAGSLHTKVEPVIIDESVHHPMGENIKRFIPTVPSGVIKYLTGQYHNIGKRQFKKNPEINDSPKARFYKSNNGLYIFELPKAHAAIVPNPTEVLFNPSD